MYYFMINYFSPFLANRNLENTISFLEVYNLSLLYNKNTM